MREIQRRYITGTDGLARIKRVKRFKSPSSTRPCTPEDAAQFLMSAIVVLNDHEHLKGYGAVLLEVLELQGLASATTTEEGRTQFVIEREALIASFKQHN
jgi:hypothetical protein